jgi:hypothetical protein
LSEEDAKPRDEGAIAVVVIRHGVDGVEGLNVVKGEGI